MTASPAAKRHPASHPSSSTAHHPGMGAIPMEQGVAFRVWAPHAESVAVTGTFNDFKPDANALESEGNGYWYGEVPKAKAGDEYKYVIRNGEQVLSRIDPYARQVTNSVGNGVIYEDDFDWEDDNFRGPAWNEMVIYELHIGTSAHRHIGTFARSEEGKPGTFDDAIKRLRYLKAIGINAIEVMPVAEFAGDLS